MERVKGIEPSSLAWEARVIPLYDARHRSDFSPAGAARQLFGILWLPSGLSSVKRPLLTKADTGQFYNHRGQKTDAMSFE